MGTLLSDVKWQHTGKFGRIKYNADSGKGCTTAVSYTHLKSKMEVTGMELHGKSVFGGIAMGRLSVYHKTDNAVKRTKITDIEFRCRSWSRSNYWSCFALTETVGNTQAQHAVVRTSTDGCLLYTSRLSITE